MVRSLKAALAVGAAFSVMVIGPSAWTYTNQVCMEDFECHIGEYCDGATSDAHGACTSGAVLCSIDDPDCTGGPNGPSSSLTVDGFLQPTGAALVNDYRDLALPTRAVRAARHVIPLRFLLFDEDLEELTDDDLADALLPAPTLWSIHVLDGSGVPSSSTEVGSVGKANTGTSFRYTGTWTYNLDTSSTGMVAGSTYVITILMPDGTFWYAAVAVH